MIYQKTMDTKVGPLTLVEEDGKLIGVSFGKSKVGYIKDTALLLQTEEELQAYFRGDRTQFDIPLELHGTMFQKKVWEALLMIPYGETRSYQDIAISIGSSKSCRAIGGANHQNPIAIIIPCHRVIGKNQKLTGYAGGIDKKEFLLDLEKRK